MTTDEQRRQGHGGTETDPPRKDQAPEGGPGFRTPGRRREGGMIGEPGSGGRTGKGPGGHGGDSGFLNEPIDEAREPGQHGGPAGQQRGGGARKG